MKNPVITIGDKKFEMKKLTVGDWAEMAAIWDEINAQSQDNVEFIKLHSKMLEMAFGLTQEEVYSLPAEDIIPIYVEITVALKEMLVVKFSDDEKKSLTEPAI